MTNRQQSSSSHPTTQAETASAPANMSPTHETPTRSLRVFLCHATQDKPAVRTLYQRLLADGIAPWFDEESLEGGEHWQQEIARAVRSTDAVIICLSASATSQASHFHTQIKLARDIANEQPDGSIFIIPFKLDACPIPERLNHLFPISLFEEGGYERLLRALRKRAQELGSAVAPASVQPHQGEEVQETCHDACFGYDHSAHQDNKIQPYDESLQEKEREPMYTRDCPVLTTGINPFEYGKPVPPERFAGRLYEIEHIKGQIGGTSAQCVSIVGLRRSGKTSLLHYIRDCPLQFCQPDQKPLIVHLDFQEQGIANEPLDITKALRTKIAEQIGTPWEESRNSCNETVNQGLNTIRDSGYRLIVLIDEFEQINKRLEHFKEWGTDWRSKAVENRLTLVIATVRTLDETFELCGLDSPFYNIFTTLKLGAFEEDEWQQLVKTRFQESGGELTPDDLALIDELSGGLPIYTQMAASFLWKTRNHKKVRKEFARFATDRFKELWKYLHPSEHQALRYAAGVPRIAAPDDGICASLQDYGLLRPNGHLFSSAFTEFVKKQK